MKNTNQKELKEKYMQVICAEVWDSKSMQDYARKSCAYVVELLNGDIIALDKPRIETSFCYGMGMYGTYTDEEFKEAEEMANHARNDAEYFIKSNMAPLTDKIEILRECLEGKKECYTFTAYNGQPEKSILKSYTATRLAYGPAYDAHRWANCPDLRKISNEDIEAIIAGLEEVKKAFSKRLETYLKKYGLSKLKVWTYCRD